MENVCIPSGLLPCPRDAKLILSQDQRCHSPEVEHSTKAYSCRLKCQKPLFFLSLIHEHWKAYIAQPVTPKLARTTSWYPLVLPQHYSAVWAYKFMTIWDSVFAQYLFLLGKFAALVNTEGTSINQKLQQQRSPDQWGESPAPGLLPQPGCLSPTVLGTARQPQMSLVTTPSHWHLPSFTCSPGTGASWSRRSLLCTATDTCLPAPLLSLFPAKPLLAQYFCSSSTANNSSIHSSSILNKTFLFNIPLQITAEITFLSSWSRSRVPKHSSKNGISAENRIDRGQIWFISVSILLSIPSA